MRCTRLGCWEWTRSWQRCLNRSYGTYVFIIIMLSLSGHLCAIWGSRTFLDPDPYSSFVHLMVMLSSVRICLLSFFTFWYTSSNFLPVYFLYVIYFYHIASVIRFVQRRNFTTISKKYYINFLFWWIVLYSGTFLCTLLFWKILVHVCSWSWGFNTGIRGRIATVISR